MDRFRLAFASLLAFAVVTSSLAGWTLLGSVVVPSIENGSVEFAPGQASTSTPVAGGPSTMVTTTTSASTETTTASMSTQTSLVSTTAVTSTTTALSETTITVTSTAASTVTAPVAGGATTTVAGTTTTPGGQNNIQGALSSLAYSPAGGESLLRQVQAVSIFLAPVSWFLLGGAWIWRGRVRSRYTEMGFGSDVFELFMKMKGGATRIKVLNKLDTPKDRLQLAEELGVDWKTVDRHVQILNRYGFVREQAAYGTVRLYEVTPVGRMLLNLFEDLERTDGPVARQST